MPTSLFEPRPALLLFPPKLYEKCNQFFLDVLICISKILAERFHGFNLLVKMALYFQMILVMNRAVMNLNIVL